MKIRLRIFAEITILTVLLLLLYVGFIEHSAAYILSSLLLVCIIIFFDL